MQFCLLSLVSLVAIAHASCIIHNEQTLSKKEEEPPYRKTLIAPQSTKEPETKRLSQNEDPELTSLLRYIHEMEDQELEARLFEQEIGSFFASQDVIQDVLETLKKEKA